MTIFWSTKSYCIFCFQDEQNRVSWVNRKEGGKKVGSLLFLEHLWYHTTSLGTTSSSVTLWLVMPSALPWDDKEKSHSFVCPVIAPFLPPPPQTRCANLHIFSFYFLIINRELAGYQPVNADDADVCVDPQTSRCKLQKFMAHVKCEFSLNDHMIFSQSSKILLLQLTVPLAVQGDSFTMQGDIHP